MGTFLSELSSEPFIDRTWSFAAFCMSALLVIYAISGAREGHIGLANREFKRSDAPVMFWFSVLLYGLLGMGVMLVMLSRAIRDPL